MRVISGTLKGRTFHPPDNSPARPTTDFAKTGLFNILVNNIDFDEVSVLDLFAGTGNISYEFASRGCKRIVSVENNHKCTEFISKMKKEWNLPIELLRSDVFRFLNSCNEKFDLIFADPPYDLENTNELPEQILNVRKLLKPGGWLILETSSRQKFAGHPHLFREKNYGEIHFHIFTAEPVTVNSQKSAE